jgi:hypothetical protein
MFDESPPWVARGGVGSLQHLHDTEKRLWEWVGWSLVRYPGTIPAKCALLSSIRVMTSLSSLIAEPKNKVDHAAGQAIVLHVFWEAPSAAAATELLEGLRKCARATHRDTPCTPTYFFRRCNKDQDLCAPAPSTVGEHPHLTQVCCR